MSTLTWKSVQKNSNQILSDGVHLLTIQPYQLFHEVKHTCYGNYLISNLTNKYYIGEGKDLGKRLKQQFKPTTSTFYKNFQTHRKKYTTVKSIPIESFKVQCIETNIGRKEIEEFGIVNLKTPLNRFQLDKRKSFIVECHNGLWNEVQAAKDELLQQAEENVLNTKFDFWFDCTALNKAGLYIVRNQNDDLIYIGESSNIFERHKTHSSQTYFSALRRHIGTEILKFQLHEKNGRKKYFQMHEEKKVNDFLRTCRATFYPVTFGRYELEEYLIRNHRPFLNRKDNKDE
ncbi:MAG: hypothetical protein EOO46_06480 [Flavobacterium sp.]|nr:MAG: hypothetical protein EOO46_06480 [Flavobacterium sp.]